MGMGLSMTQYIMVVCVGRILASDEADELGHTLLHALLGILRHLGYGHACHENG